MDRSGNTQQRARTIRGSTRQRCHNNSQISCRWLLRSRRHDGTRASSCRGPADPAWRSQELPIWGGTLGSGRRVGVGSRRRDSAKRIHPTDYRAKAVGGVRAGPKPARRNEPQRPEPASPAQCTSMRTACVITRPCDYPTDELPYPPSPIRPGSCGSPAPPAAIRQLPALLPQRPR